MAAFTDLRYGGCCLYFLIVTMCASRNVASKSCGNAYFSDEKGECILCPKQCKVCDSNTKCLSCVNGYWGNVCELPCTKCQTGTACEKTNGFCLEACRDGKSGILCDVLCDSKCFSCNRTNIEVCLKCASGRYPPVYCKRNCSSCHNTACNETGSCLSGCAKGHWGTKCESRCSKNCLNNSCDWYNGTCTYGCEENYVLPYCSNSGQISTEGETNRTLVIVIVIVVVFVFVSVVISIIVLVKKRRTPTREYKQCKIAKSIERKTERDCEKEWDRKPPTRKDKLREIAKSIGRKTERDYKKEWDEILSRCRDQIPTERDRLQANVQYENNTVPFTEEAGSLLNAKYIKDMEGQQKTYIACKGPTTKHARLFAQFWRMIRNEKCHLIVMLNNLETEDDQYWPDAGGLKEYDKISVKCLEEINEKTHLYFRRDFEVKEESETFCVTQFQYKDWPERKRHKNIKNFLDFYEAVNLHVETSKICGPVVVHERAGVGRTGTFIALDILRKGVEEMLDSVDSVEENIRSCVVYLRTQSDGMVETVEQYKFLHEASVEVIEKFFRKRSDDGSN